MYESALSDYVSSLSRSLHGRLPLEQSCSSQSESMTNFWITPQRCRARTRRVHHLGVPASFLSPPSRFYLSLYPYGPRTVWCKNGAVLCSPVVAAGGKPQRVFFSRRTGPRPVSIEASRRTPARRACAPAAGWGRTSCRAWLIPITFLGPGCRTRAASLPGRLFLLVARCA